MADLTAALGKEVALYEKAGGIFLNLGEKGSVIVTGAIRVIAHTHPIQADACYGVVKIIC